jgi:hypothetical protein
MIFVFYYSVFFNYSANIKAAVHCSQRLLPNGRAYFPCGERSKKYFSLPGSSMGVIGDTSGRAGSPNGGSLC